MINATFHISSEEKVFVGVNRKSVNVILLRMRSKRKKDMIAHEQSVSDAVVDEEGLVVRDDKVAAVIVTVFGMI